MKSSTLSMGLIVLVVLSGTDFATPTIHVQLIIGASSTSDGSYRIIFEHKPLRADFEKGKKFHEKDAL